MLIYILLVAEIVLLNIMHASSKISKHKMCWIIGVSMILITGLRDVTVGGDTANYFMNFKEIDGMTLSEVIAWNKRDFGYFILMWFVNRFTGSFTVLTMIAAIAFYVPVTMLIEKHSDDAGLSFLTLIAFNFFQFSMTGIRQTIAIGMAILFVMELLNKKPRYLRCLFWVFIGSTIHKSALLMLIFLILRLFWNKKNSIYITLFLIPITLVFRDSILSYLEEPLKQLDFDMGEYEDATGGFTTFLVFAILLIWGIVLTRKGKNTKSETMPIYLLFLFELAVVLQPMVFSNSVFFRIVWYFSIYMIIYIPKLIKTSMITQGNKAFVKVIVYAGVLYMYLFMTMSSANVLPYRFFFQG